MQKLIIIACLLWTGNTSLLAQSCLKIEAEDRDEQSGGYEGDNALVTPRSGEWIAFDNVDFSGASQVTVSAARGDGSAEMKVYLDAPDGQLLGTKSVNTGGWRTFKDHKYSVSGISGKHKLYIKAGTPEKPVVRTIKVNGTTAFSKAAAQFDDLSKSLRDRDFYFVSIQSEWIKFNQLDLTDVTSIKGYIANGTTGKLEVRIDKSDGTKIAEFNVGKTDWRKFKTYTTTVNQTVSGKHDVYLVHNSGSHGGIVDYFELCKPAASTVPVSTISVGGPSSITTDGGNTQLSASVSPSNASDKSVKWTIQGTDLGATLSSTGKLTASGEDGGNGKITVRATAQDGSGKFGEREVTITNQSTPAPGVTQHTITASAGSNGSVSPEGSVAVEEGKDQTFTFTPQSGYQIKDVLVDGKSQGTKNTYTFSKVAKAHTISVSFESVSTSAEPTNVAVESVMITGPATITTNGDSIQFSATVSPADATNKSVKWTIQGVTFGNTLSSGGKLTASGQTGGNGTVTVRATAQDGSGKFGEHKVAISNQRSPEAVVTSIGQPQADLIKVFPNPTKNLLRVISPQPVTLQLFTTTGTALNLPAHQQRIDVSSLAPGVYLLHIRQIDQRSIKRILINP